MAHLHEHEPQRDIEAGRQEQHDQPRELFGKPPDIGVQEIDDGLHALAA
jgi:hypothetical protein